MAMILLLLMLAVIISIIAWTIYRKSLEDIETTTIREPKYTSPSIHLIYVVMREYLKSFASILLLMSIIAITVLSAFTTASSFVTTEILFEPPIKTKYFAIYSDITELVHNIHAIGKSVVIVQIFRYVDLVINGSKYRVLPLVLVCNKEVSTPLLNVLCRMLRACDVILHSYYFTKYSGSYVFIENVSLKPCFANLSETLDLEILPSIYFVHTIGSIGGTSIRIRDPEGIVIGGEKLLRIVCRNSCPAKAYVFSDVRDLVIDGDVFGELDASTGKLTIISTVMVPSASTLIGLALSILIAIVIAISTCTGVIEKVRSLAQTLVIQGVTTDTVRIASSLAMFLMLMLVGIPVVLVLVARFGSLPAASASITLILSSIAVSSVISYRLKHAYPYTTAEEPVVPERSFVYHGTVNLEEVVKCMKSYLEKDEFFELSEIETLSLSSNTLLIRFELVYRYAMAVIASIELSVDLQDPNVVVIEASSSLWSYEELEKSRSMSIENLALSKIMGALKVCIESSRQ